MDEKEATDEHDVTVEEEEKVKFFCFFSLLNQSLCLKDFI